MHDEHHDCDHHSSRVDSGEKHHNYPNETIRLLHERSSCRSYGDKTVSEETMNMILEAGIHAPTGGNLQPYSIIRIENQNTRAELARLCGNQDWIEKSPVNLLFCIDLHRLEKWAELELAPFTAKHQFRQFWISFQDVIIAAQNICTAADALGLGSVYIGTVLECMRELRDMFVLPEGVFPVVLLCLGYPKMRPQLARKLGLEMIVHKEKYREPSDTELVSAYERKYPTWRREVTDERLKKLFDVCQRVHGREFAEKAIERVTKNKYISPAQILFGLHYCADEMAEGNEEFVNIIEDAGFNWFKKYKPESAKK